AEPFQLVGLVVGSRIVTRRFLSDMRGLIRFLAKVAVATSIAAIGFALAPNIVVAVAVNCVISASLAMLGPGILVALSLATSGFVGVCWCWSLCSSSAASCSVAPVR